MFGLNQFGSFNRPMDEADSQANAWYAGMPEWSGGGIGPEGSPNPYRNGRTGEVSWFDPVAYSNPNIQWSDPVGHEGPEGSYSLGGRTIKTVGGVDPAQYRAFAEGNQYYTMGPNGKEKAVMLQDGSNALIPESLATQYLSPELYRQATVQSYGDANRTWMDYLGEAMPAAIMAFATSGASLAGQPMFGDVAGGLADTNTNALVAGGESGVGATGAYVPNAGIDAVNANLGLGGATSASELASMGLTQAGMGYGAAGAAGLGAAGFNPDPYITDVGTSGTGAADFSGLAGPASGLPSWMNAIKPYTGLIGGALSAGGALLGANQISGATKDAAALASGSADRSIDLQRQMYEQNQANLAPYLAAGRNALGRITTGIAPGGEFSKNFSMNDFTADPGYGFRMAEGLKAMERNAAARGGLISGAALKAGTRYGQDMASQEYTNAFNRYQTNRGNQLAPLQSLAGIGQTTVNNLANVGANYASNVGNIDTNAANVRANAGLTSGAGYASAYGAVGNALNNAFNPNPVMAYLQSLNKQGVA